MKIEQNNILYVKAFFQKIIKSNIFFLLILILTVFLIYGKSINYDFLSLDDERLVSGNINFISDIKNLPKIFITDCYYTENSVDGYYRPILSLSFVIESLIFYNNTKIYHITNLILFILSLYLMYIFLLKFNLNKHVLQFTLLLIAVHPILTSVPVWIAARNDSLLAIFTLLTFINVLEYLKKDNLKNFILSILFFSISLFTKESALVLLVILPILMFSINKFNIKKLLNLYFGFLLFILLYIILRKIAGVNNPILFDLNNYVVFCKNMIYGFVVYISTFLNLIDVPICLFDFSLDIYSILKAILFVFFIIFIYYKNFIDRKLIILGLAFFVLYLLPTFFILQNQVLFHRLLLPILGIILIVVLIIQKIIEHIPSSKKYFIFSFIILFLSLSYNSCLQANKYKNNEIFFFEGYKNAPTYHVFLSNIGNLYSNEHDYDKALEFKLLAEKYKPGLYFNDIASILCYQKRFDEAEEILNRSTDTLTKEFVYANLSLIYEEKKDYKKSLEYAEKAYKKNPYNIEISINLARKYFLNEKYFEAIDVYLNLLKLNNKEAGYYYSISLLYEKLGEREKALEFINKAIKIDGDNIKYKQFLSSILND